MNRYEKQLTIAMERLDESLKILRDTIKRGDQQGAINYMENGDLKERYEELQNIITISQTGNIGARGTSQTGTF